MIVAIGAQNTFVLRQGIRGEHQLSIALICALSDALLITVGVAGLGEIVGHNPALLLLAKYAGALFLFVYGGMSARRAWLGEQLEIGESQSVSRLAAITTCLCMTYLNPHVYLDTVVLLGALASQEGKTGRWFFGMGATLSSFLWFFSLAYGARYLAPMFKKPGVWRVLDSAIALLMWFLSFNLLQG